jgi:exonuclease SbcC
MQFNSITVRGLGPFKSEVRLDVDSLPGPLVAITGPNGSGKSTLLGLLAAGCIDREIPTSSYGKYQTLAELATSRSSMVEVTLTNGHRYTIRQVVDSQTGSGASVLLGKDGMSLRDEKGQVIVPDGKVSKFDAWAKKAFKPQDVREVSIFSAQGHSGVFDLTGGDLKAVILRVRGIERYETLSKRAGEHAKEYRELLVTLTARIKDERERGADLQKLTEERERLQELISMASGELKRAEAALVSARAEFEEVNKTRALNTEMRRSISEAKQRLYDAERKHQVLQDRLTHEQAVLEQRDEIEAAILKEKELESKLSELQVALEREAAKQQAITEVGKSLKQQLARAEQDSQAVKDRLERSRRLLNDAPAIKKAVSQLAGLQERLSSASQFITGAEEQLSSVRSVQLASESERVNLLRVGHQTIKTVGTIAKAKQTASETLETDDKLLDEGLHYSETLRVAQEEVKAAHQAETNARKALSEAQMLAGRAESLDHAEVLQKEAELDLARLNREMAETTKEIGQQITNWKKSRESSDVLVSRSNEARFMLTTIKPLAEKAGLIGNAKTLVKELQGQLKQGDVEVRTLTTAISKLPEPEKDPDLPDVNLAEGRVRLAREELTAAEKDLVLTQHRESQAKESAARYAELDAERKEVEQELSDWVRLEDDFGKKGIQALEVDAAGPELSDLTNELLRECFSSRWTIEIATTRDSATGKKEIEQCEVTITDHVEGRIAAAKSLSGGQKAIVGEAISSALSVMACRHGGVDSPTLIRDETDSSLTEENAPLYVAMVRSVALKTDAHKVLLVSHNPEVWKLCNSVVRLTEDHRVEIVR